VSAKTHIGNIALSFSGGGVRAVGFHLGTLDMLDRLELLPNVTVLSTVSGGSLTGIGYSLSQHLGHDFDTFFGNFYDFLPKLNTIEHLLEGLASDAAPVPSGRRDMITVMANIYDDEYFRKYYGVAEDGERTSPRFSMLQGDGAPTSHLREMVFNATEFQTGSAFRFQKSEYRCLVGNANIYLCDAHVPQIRIADIMAASSCIPAGMEPLFFPQDFHWPDDPAEPGGERTTCERISQSFADNLHKSFHLYPEKTVDHVALMDGGVYDNQGIVSTLLALNRQATKVPPEPKPDCVCGSNLYEGKQAPGPEDWAKWLAGQLEQGHRVGEEDMAPAMHEVIDTIIISDTPVLKDSQYPKIGQSATDIEPIPAAPSADSHERKRGLTLGSLDRIGWITALVLLLSGAVTFYEEIWPNRDWQVGQPFSLVDDVLQVIIPLTIVIGLGLILMMARRKLRDIGNGMFGALPADRWRAKDPWQYLRRLRIRDLVDMAKLRVGSVSALTASIFMNRIRALSYSAAYSRQSLGEHIIANQIFALERDTSGSFPGLAGEASLLAKLMSDDAAAIVALAAHMPTKLWINRIRPQAVVEKATGMEMSDPLAAATARVVAFNEQRAADGKAPLNDLDVLVICGQLTICHKIMIHLWERYADEGGGWGDNTEAHVQFKSARKLWTRLCKEPAYLLDERKGSMTISA